MYLILRSTLFELERTRKRFQERDNAYLEKHPKMLENSRQVLDVKKSLISEVTAAIEDLKDKRMQFSAQEREFQVAMNKVQEESMELSTMEEWLSNKERELAVVRRSTDQMQSRLNEVKIEQALPSEQEEPLRKENFAYLPGAPYTPDKAKIKSMGFAIFLHVSLQFHFV